MLLRGVVGGRAPSLHLPVHGSCGSQKEKLVPGLDRTKRWQSKHHVINSYVRPVRRHLHHPHQNPCFLLPPFISVLVFHVTHLPVISTTPKRQNKDTGINLTLNWLTPLLWHLFVYKVWEFLGGFLSRQIILITADSCSHTRHASRTDPNISPFSTIACLFIALHTLIMIHFNQSNHLWLAENSYIYIYLFSWRFCPKRHTVNAYGMLQAFSHREASYAFTRLGWASSEWPVKNIVSVS